MREQLQKEIICQYCSKDRDRMGRLVLFEGREKNGEPSYFVGCSNYPSCKVTLKVNLNRRHEKKPPVFKQKI